MPYKRSVDRTIQFTTLKCAAHIITSSSGLQENLIEPTFIPINPLVLKTAPPESPGIA